MVIAPPGNMQLGMHTFCYLNICTGRPYRRFRGWGGWKVASQYLHFK